MRYEVSQEPKDVEPGDIAVMRLVTTKGAVKWTCGNEANKFFDDERARPTDDCQYCANRHDPVRVTHVDVLKPIRNSIHDVQSTTGGVSCRI